MPDNRENRHGLEGFPSLPLSFHHPFEISSTAQEEPLQKEKGICVWQPGPTLLPPASKTEQCSLWEGTQTLTQAHAHEHTQERAHAQTFTHSQLPTYLSMLGNNFLSSCREHMVIKNKENKGLGFARWLRFQIQTCKFLGKINLQITKAALLLHLPLQHLTVPPTNSFIDADPRIRISTIKSLGMQ